MIPPSLVVLFQCPDCKAKKEAYLLQDREEDGGEYSIALCSGCSGMFELQKGLDLKWVPPPR
jgi:DNA-directed RNA polymerase subunit M/transcription elongation factor TFIIS